MPRSLLIVLTTALLHGQAANTGGFDMRVETTAARPVAGARLSLQGPDNQTYTGATDADGRFRLVGLPAGTYKVLAFDAPGYTRTSGNYLEDFSIQPGQTRTTRFELVPAGRIEGTLTDESGNPIPGATIVATNRAPRSREVRANATTNAMGAYSVSLAPHPSTFLESSALALIQQVSVYAYIPREQAVRGGQAYLPAASQSLIVRPGSVQELDFQLQRSPAFRVRGNVNGAAATVSLSPCGTEEESLSSTVPLSADGSFDLAGVLPGSYCVSAGIEDRWSSPVVVRITDSDAAPVTLTAPR